LVLVSVLIPSYNYEKYLSETIESVLDQSFKDFELIILDDFSRDNSRAIIENYQRKDKRIKAYFHEKNMGMASTINDLLSKASGKYVAYLDSDDLWDKLKLERQLAVLEKNDSLVVYSEGEIIDGNGVPTGQTFTQTAWGSNKKKSGRIFEELLFENFVFQSSLIHKRNIAKDIQFDEKLKYINDYKFWVDLAKEHQFFFIKTPLAKYRVHGKNTLFADKKDWHKDYITLYQYFLREYDKGISKRAKAKLYFDLTLSYYFLNEKESAKFFFIKALKSNWAIYELKSVMIDEKESLIKFLSFAKEIVKTRKLLR
jgi:glycosyltransferase involved in cell wall biosynthesis